MRLACPQERLDCLPIADVQLNANCRDEIIPLLRALQHMYGDADRRRQLMDLVGKDVNQTTSRKRGRRGLNYWEITVLAAVRLGCNLDYDKLQDLAENHRRARLAKLVAVFAALALPAVPAASQESLSGTQRKDFEGRASRRAEEAQKAEVAGDFAAARQARREILELRTRLHGAGHWEVVDARLDLAQVETLARLDADQREQLRRAEETNSRFLELYTSSRHDEAAPLAEEALGIHRRLLGEEHRLTARGHFHLADNLQKQGRHAEAERHFLRTLAVRQKLLGEEHPETTYAYNRVANSLFFQGKYADAEPLYRKTLELQRRVFGEERAETATSFNNLANALYFLERYAEAEPLYRQALAVRQKLWPEGNLETAGSHNDLGNNLYRQGKYVEAEAQHRRALALYLRLRGEGNLETAWAYQNLARDLYDQGRYAEAEPYYRQALAARRKLLGERSPDTVWAAFHLANALGRQGKHAEAEPLYAEVLAARREALGAEHPDTVAALDALAENLDTQEKYAEAEPLFRQLLVARRKSRGEVHTVTAWAYLKLSACLLLQARFEEGEQALDRALDIVRRAEGEGSAGLGRVQALAGLQFVYRGQLGRGELLIRQGLAVCRRAQGDEHPDIAPLLEALALTLALQGKQAKAEELQRQVLAIRQKHHGPSSKEAAAALERLAARLAERGQPAEAEALQRQALELRGNSLWHMLEVGISLAIAAVPEGLPAVATMTLALGMQRMARMRALVRRLPAVETLGSTTVICSDKTGTLTRNEMTVRAYQLADRRIEVTGTGYVLDGEFREGGRLNPAADPHLALALQVGALCADASLDRGDGTATILGDPTEGALLVAADKAGLRPEDLERDYPRIGEVPFTSESKRMVTVHRMPEGRTVAYLKGAPAVILDASQHEFTGDGVRPFGPEDRQRFLAVNGELAGQALRVLALAYKDVGDDWREDDLAGGLVLVGLVGMIDPLREEAKAAIATCRQAGIRTIMITGDQEATAAEIGRQLGLDRDPQGRPLRAVHDRELAHLDAAGWQRVAAEAGVFARVSPEHKLRIVEALQALGEVVAMTGDGVNDAPALKKADIGVAMGIKGTEVAKEASDIVITDDNFTSIVAAVEQGRIIYANIVRFIHYLFSCNLSEILVVFLAILLDWPLPLAALQVLWLNMITDVFPAMALALEPSSPDAMKRPPRNPKEPLVSWRFVGLIGWQGVLLAGLTLLAFRVALGWYEAESGGQRQAVTVAFMTLALAQVFHTFNARSQRRSAFDAQLFTNGWLWGTVLVCVALQLAAVYWPFLQTVLHTAPLGVADWALVVGCSLAPVAVVEVVKWSAGPRWSPRERPGSGAKGQFDLSGTWPGSEQILI